MDGDGRSWFEQLSMACGGQCRLPVLTPNLLQTSLCGDLQVEELFKATGHIPCSLRHGLNFSAFWKGIEQNFGGLLLSFFYLLVLSFRIWQKPVVWCSILLFVITGWDETRLAFGESCSGLRDSCKIWGVRIWTWRSDLSWRQSFGWYLSGKATFYVQISRDDIMQLLTKKLTPTSYFSTIYRQYAEFPLYFGPGSEVICQGICQTQRPTVSVSSIGTTGVLQRAPIFGDFFFFLIFISVSHT